MNLFSYKNLCGIIVEKRKRVVEFYIPEAKLRNKIM